MGIKELFGRAFEPRDPNEDSAPRMSAEWHAQQARDCLRAAEKAVSTPQANACAAQSVAHSNLAVYEQRRRYFER